MKQKTLKGSFSLFGKGLHTGLNLTVTFNPAPENTGYKIQRIDMEGEPIESESGYYKDDKECTEEEALELSNQLGEWYTINPTWHPIDISKLKSLSNYAE